MGFFENFKEKVDYKKLYKTWNFQHCNWVLSEYTQAMQIFFPIKAVFMKFCDMKLCACVLKRMGLSSVVFDMVTA